jgi:gamma-glutamyltranspeptidase / glutathione hydrolase
MRLPNSRMTKIVQCLGLHAFVWLLLVGAVRAEVTRSHGLIAEKTEWETSYFVIDSGAQGPTLLVTGGLHGNEPAGYRAAEQIRHWPIQCGKLIVVPRVNSPGLKQNTRWLPGEPNSIRNANRNFPKIGELNEARSVPIKALWTFMQEQNLDWVVDLHEGFDFNIANPNSVGSSIIYFDTPEMQTLAAKIHADVNATIEDPNRKIVRRSKSGPVNGGLVRASVERLGAKGFCFETTFQYQPLSTRTRQHRIMVHRLMQELNMVGSKPVSGQSVRAENGMVVSASGDASRIGCNVLQRGGNAVDAAVATAFALAVTWPEAGNIGGGGFMMIHPGDSSPAVCIDYRETGPGAVTSTMFENDDRRHTRKMVGVPGTVRGLALAHQKYGRLPWRELVLPAAELAKNGFDVDAELASSTNRVLASLPEPPAPEFAELRRVYGKPGAGPWKPGDRMVLKDLAATFRCIANEGPDAFYTGKIADQIIDEMQRGDGIMTKADLDQYEAKVRQAIRGRYRGYDILGPPPPSSGGICLIQMLNVLENFDLRSHARHSARNMHIIAEAMRRAFRDRATHLGDPDFVSIPEHLTDKAYARRLASKIDMYAATSSESLAGEIELAPESTDTTHFSVIDSDGMAVSNTYTLEASWGARIVVRGGGFLLNNEMGDFNRKPGSTDRKGAIGTIPNRITPHKRMLSSQTPVIVTREGRVVLLTGSPGGRTIINTVLAVLLNVLEFGMDLPASVACPRLHHQWFPDELIFEGLNEDRYSAAVDQLRAMGHSLKLPAGNGQQGDAHSIWVDLETGMLCGMADQRRGGKAAGY